jgi:hypothetical protein
LPTYGTATEKFIEKRFFKYVEITENKHNPKTNVKKVGQKYLITAFDGVFVNLVAPTVPVQS